MIYVFYGPKSSFRTMVPKDDVISLTEYVLFLDDKSRTLKMKIEGVDEVDEDNAREVSFESTNLVGYSDDYSAMSESALSSFDSLIKRISNFKNVYLQNPPSYVTEQLEKTGSECCVERHEYQSLRVESLGEIDGAFDDVIIGQRHVKDQLLIALLPFIRKDTRKPLTLLFYGPTGVGKTETAKFLSKALHEKLIRKQFSMFQGNDFVSYLFGAKHHENSFARELLERESNLILLDEFDKPNPVFHSAFYQLFDEGIFEDKNYRVEARETIIICTSNYTSESDVKQWLGEPIFSRFDAVIEFKPLDGDSASAIFEKEWNLAIDDLSEGDAELIDEKMLHDKAKEFSGQLANARQVRKFIQDYLSIELIQVFRNRKWNL